MEKSTDRPRVSEKESGVLCFPGACRLPGGGPVADRGERQGIRGISFNESPNWRVVPFMINSDYLSQQNNHEYEDIALFSVHDVVALNACHIQG